MAMAASFANSLAVVTLAAAPSEAHHTNSNISEQRHMVGRYCLQVTQSFAGQEGFEFDSDRGIALFRSCMQAFYFY
jgi:hypothetical protein